MITAAYAIRISIANARFDRRLSDFVGLVCVTVNRSNLPVLNRGLVGPREIVLSAISNRSFCLIRRKARGATLDPLVNHRQNHDLDRSSDESTDDDNGQRFLNLRPGSR